MVKALRNKTNKPIVFHCNDRTCYKYYKAAKAFIKNLFCNFFRLYLKKGDYCNLPFLGPVLNRRLITTTNTSENIQTQMIIC